MNRDEKRVRARGLPPAPRNVGGRIAVYPSEPGGGTWIALNDRGVSLALVNWYSVSVRANADAISRGEIIPSLIDSTTPALMNARCAAFPLGRINPFRLIGVFPASREITEWRWDLNRLARKRHPWEAQQWISSGFDERTAREVRTKVFREAQTQPAAGTLNWLRRLHRSHLPARGPFSTCMHRADAATVSYTEIVVAPPRAGMRHVGGPPCEGSDMRWHGAPVRLRPAGSVVLPLRIAA